MNLTDIQQEVSYLMAGEPVNLATISKYTNKCMDVLSTRYDTACLIDDKSYVVTDGGLPVALPESCIGVYKILNENNYKHSGFLVTGEGITFGRAGEFDVYYYKRPVMAWDNNPVTPVAIKDDVPPIDAAYHKSIPKFIAGELIKIVNPKDARIEIYVQDFLLETKEADSRLHRLKRKGRRVHAPVWR